MIRRLGFGSGWLLALLLVTPAAAQDRADRVQYLDRTKTPEKETVRTGTVTAETPAKVSLKGAADGKLSEVSVADVVDVQYGVEPPELSQARTAERNKDLDKALARYRDGLKAAPANHKFLQAHIQFKIAKLTAQRDEAGPGRAAAIEDLRKFLKDHPDARQTVEALDLLSRLLLLDGQSTQEVVAGFRRLREKYADSKEITAKCDAFEGRILIQEAQSLLKSQPEEAKKKYAEARAKLQGMTQAPDRTVATDAKIGLAECKAVLGQADEALADLKNLLKDANDERTKAAVYLGRGDCYRLTKQYREAMWDYLWVDVIYNQDREQAARALFHLQEVFEQLQDPAKAKEARDRLLTDPRFRDTRYQKLAGAK
jgi:tetratricopeptide (TPR) repeat protein